jgi:histidinol dehydrogenase
MKASASLPTVGAATSEVLGGDVAGPVRRGHVARFTKRAAARRAATAASLAAVGELPAHAAAARKRPRFDEEKP